MKLLLENWREYLKEASGGENTRVYHGSLNAVFPAFEIRAPDEKTHDYGFFGDGLYFDTSLRAAIDYANGDQWDFDIGEQNIKAIEDAIKGDKTNLIPQSNAVRIIGDKGRENAGVYVLDLQISNPYYWKGQSIPSIINNPVLNSLPEDIADDVAKGLGKDNWEDLVAAIKSPKSISEERWQEFFAFQVSKTVRDKGHDGIIMRRSNGQAEMIVFDSSQIKNALK